MSQRRILLIVGGPDYHNKPFQYGELASIVAGDGGYDLRMTANLDVLEPSVLAEYDAVMAWSSALHPSTDQIEALLEAVRGGLGFFGLHGGTTMFWNSAEYLHFIGSRFLKHGPYRSFQVDIDDRGHPITRGIDGFVTDDELYELGGNAAEFDAIATAITSGTDRKAIGSLGAGPLGPELHVLASAEGWPLLYTRNWGSGRMHYNALGHDLGSLQRPEVRRLILQGLEWVIGS